MNYGELCKGAMKVVMQAASYVREHHENRSTLQVERKGQQDYVTSVDKGSEEILVRGLGKLLPGSGFIAEEGTGASKGELYNWIIDPIDGTTNFIHGAYPFAISVALSEGDEVVVGLVYEFGQDELFTAWKDGGAYCNGKSICVSATPKVEQSLIATGFPYTNFSLLTEFMESMDFFMKNCNGLRRLGSAATDIAWVACGRYDGFYEYGLHPWDIAAGMILVKEAGGDHCDFEGGPNPLFREDFICGNAAIFDEFSGQVKNIMLKNS